MEKGLLKPMDKILDCLLSFFEMLLLVLLDVLFFVF